MINWQSGTARLTGRTLLHAVFLEHGPRLLAEHLSKWTRVWFAPCVCTMEGVHTIGLCQASPFQGLTLCELHEESGRSWYCPIFIHTFEANQLCDFLENVLLGHVQDAP